MRERHTQDIKTGRVRQTEGARHVELGSRRGGDRDRADRGGKMERERRQRSSLGGRGAGKRNRRKENDAHRETGTEERKQRAEGALNSVGFSSSVPSLPLPPHHA